MTKRKYQQNQAKRVIENRHSVKSLDPLSTGTEVKITSHPESGVIQKETDCTRQYELKTPTGTIKRNRVQLVPLPQQGDDLKTQSVERHSEPELNILSRPKRTVKLSLKAREGRV